MIVFIVQSQAIAYYSRQLPLVAAILVLAVLALRKWAYELRPQLSPWRNILDLVSISSVLISLLALVIPFLFSVLRVETHISASDWIAGITLLALLATCLGFALRGLARIEIVLAGLLTVALVLINVRV